jgi:hypothetical protein
MYGIQKDDKNDLKIEILMLLISSYFTFSKKNERGFFDRYTWLITNDKVTLLLSLLQKKVFKSLNGKTETNEEEGGDID